MTGKEGKKKGHVIPKRLLVHGDPVACNQGTCLGMLQAGGGRGVRADTIVTANIDDMHVTPFGECKSMGYPGAVAASAAGIPVICTPLPMIWYGASRIVKINGSFAVTTGSNLQCAWGGKITSILNQVNLVNIPE